MTAPREQTGPGERRGPDRQGGPGGQSGPGVQIGLGHQGGPGKQSEPGKQGESTPLDTNGLTLRAMTIEDLPVVLRFEHALFGAQAWSEQMILEELADPLTRWYIVAQVDGAIAGYAGLAAFGDEAHVMTIGTDPELQGRGIGRAMLRALLDEAERRGAKQVILEVRVDNVPAIAMYRSEGFETVGVRKRYYQPENVDAAVMIRG